MPLVFLAVNTFYGGFLNIRDNFWPLTQRRRSPRCTCRATCCRICTAIMIVLAIVILVSAIAKWVSVLSSPQRAVPAEG